MPLAELKKELIDLVRDFGSVRAEKSFLLHEISQEMLVTFESSVSVDAAAVERFRLALLESNQTRMFKKIFLQDVRFTLAPEAAAPLKALPAPKMRQ